jgi:hypothetical protein
LRRHGLQAGDLGNLNRQVGTRSRLTQQCEPLGLFGFGKVFGFGAAMIDFTGDDLGAARAAIAGAAAVRQRKAGFERRLQNVPVRVCIEGVAARTQRDAKGRHILYSPCVDAGNNSSGIKTLDVRRGIRNTAELRHAVTLEARDGPVGRHDGRLTWRQPQRPYGGYRHGE